MDEQLLRIIAWPSAVIIIVIAALFMFRGSIASLLQKHGVRYRGFELGPGGAGDQEQPGPIDTARAVEELLAEVDRNPIVQEGERLLQSVLRDKGITEPADAYPVLLRHTAGAYIALRFERTYNLIFGSQISLLRFLNGKRQTGSDEETLKEVFFKPVESTLGPHGIVFDNYVGWLEAVGLIVRDKETIRISDLGVSFLAYLTWQGLLEEKAG